MRVSDQLATFPPSAGTGVPTSRPSFVWVAVFLVLLQGAVLLAAHPAFAATAVDDSYSVASGGLLQVTEGGVLANDCCASHDPLTASLESPAAHGEVTLNPDGSFTYQNDGSGATSDSFQYRASDSGDYSIATVTIAVLVSGTPVASGDSYSVTLGGTLDIAAPGVLANDFDPDGDPLTAVLVNPPAFASQFSLAADGGFTYVNDASLVGSELEDGFTYSVTDGQSSSEAVSVNINFSGSPGSTTYDVVTVQFSEVTGVEVGTRIGPALNNVKETRFLIHASNAPATASGPGAPAQTLLLDLRSTDEAAFADIRDQFKTCQKAALIAQARPDLYTLEVRIELPTGSISQASEEVFGILLNAGVLSCTVDRLP